MQPCSAVCLLSTRPPLVTGDLLIHHSLVRTGAFRPVLSCRALAPRSCSISPPPASCQLLRSSLSVLQAPSCNALHAPTLGSSAARLWRRSRLSCKAGSGSPGRVLFMVRASAECEVENKTPIRCLNPSNSAVSIKDSNFANLSIRGSSTPSRSWCLVSDTSQAQPPAGLFLYNASCNLFFCLTLVLQLLTATYPDPACAGAAGAVEKFALSLKGSKSVEKVLSAASGPLVTAETVAAVMEVEEEEASRNWFGLESYDRLLADAADWYTNLQLLPEGESLAGGIAAAFRGFMERLTAIELSAALAAAERWAIFTPLLAGAMWWQMRRSNWFRGPEEEGVGRKVGRSGVSNESVLARAPRVRQELFRLRLQAQLNGLLDKAPPLLLQHARGVPEGTAAVGQGTVAEKQRAVEQLMRQLMELGPRRELLVAPSAALSIRSRGNLWDSGNDAPVPVTVSELPSESVERALEGSWELVYVSTPADLAVRQVSAVDPAAADDVANGSGVQGSAQPLPQLLLQRLVQARGVVPALDFAGPIVQTIERQQRGTRMQGAGTTSDAVSESTKEVTGGADAPTVQSQDRALGSDGLWTNNTATVRLGPLGVMEISLGVAWAGKGASSGAEAANGFVHSSGSAAGLPSPNRSSAEDEVSVESLSLKAVEVLGTPVSVPRLPLVSGQPLTLRVPQFLQPVRGGSMHLCYIDECFRIDRDDTGSLFLFRKDSP